MDSTKLGYSPLTSNRDEEYVSFREKRINRDADSQAYNVHLDELRNTREPLDYSMEKKLAPWLTEQDSLLENTNIKLHNEIALFTRYMLGDSHSEREKAIEE
jgi:DNA polymerase sigma